MAKVLIIGGSRFIGKHVLQKLHSDGHEITVINRGSIDYKKYLPEGVIHIKANRDNEEEMKAAISDEFDICFDICAITKKHVTILLNALEGKVRRHVHVSSGSVYDTENVLSIPLDEDHPFPELNEDTHPYVLSKTEAELELFKAFKERSYPMTIVRPTYVYGPDNYIYREAYFFDRVSRERPILLPENGEGYFDMVYVDDLADLIIRVGFEDKIVIGEAFNGSFEKMMSANMYLKTVEKILSKNSEVIYYSHDELKEIGWPEDRYIYPYMPTGAMNFSNRKAERLLGFTFVTDYHNGLSKAFAWWKTQENIQPDFELEDLLIQYLKERSENNLTMLQEKLHQLKKTQ
ncbi:MAG: NAD-dependent epimerase/dehydratase family protein [Candidatus Heimdallarchaeota archaeon]|nr:NAD-dependent epimerase/dehydratase family protein [Candidatus Heimdallarchaeota archaeon]